MRLINLLTTKKFALLPQTTLSRKLHKILFLVIFPFIMISCVEFNPNIATLEISDETTFEFLPLTGDEASYRDLNSKLDTLKKDRSECESLNASYETQKNQIIELNSSIKYCNEQINEAKKQKQETINRCPFNIFDLFCKTTRDSAIKSVDNLIAQCNKLIDKWNAESSLLQSSKPPSCAELDLQIKEVESQMYELEKAFVSRFPVSSGNCNGTKFHDPRYPEHQGLDVGKKDEEIKASWKGKVVRSQKDEHGTAADGGFGNSVVVEYACSDIPQSDKEQMHIECQDGQSIFVRYAHMQGDILKYGEEVSPGKTVLGHVGNTGNTGTTNGNKDYVLHIEVRVGKSGSYASPTYNPAIAYSNIGSSTLNPEDIFPTICQKR